MDPNLPPVSPRPWRKIKVALCSLTGFTTNGVGYDVAASIVLMVDVVVVVCEGVDNGRVE
jgi:hypothetical protein